MNALRKWPTTLQVKTKSAADDKLIEDQTYRETCTQRGWVVYHLLSFQCKRG